MGAKDQGDDLSRNRYQVIPRTLIFITHGDEVLLLKGSPQKRIWPGLYNGIGGHIERWETVYDAARREIAEEVGLTAIEDLRLRGTINIDVGQPDVGIMLFVFTAVSPTREVHPSCEGDPQWVNWRVLNPSTMVEDLPILLPRVLSMGPDAPPFFARYWYDEADRLQVAFSP